MANNIKQVDNVNGSKMNLGQIEIAAIRGVEQGLTQIIMLDVTTQTDTAAEALNEGDAGKTYDNYFEYFLKGLKDSYDSGLG